MYVCDNKKLKEEYSFISVAKENYQGSLIMTKAVKFCPNLIFSFYKRITENSES